MLREIPYIGFTLGIKPDIESTHCNLKQKTVIDTSQENNALSFTFSTFFLKKIFSVSNQSLSQIQREYMNVD